MTGNKKGDLSLLFKIDAVNSTQPAVRACL